MISEKRIEDSFRQIQKKICSELELHDGKAQFVSDVWHRPGGGGGISNVISSGQLIEKGGVNFSAVFGEFSDELKTEFNVPHKEFYATGVSIVLHPVNPFVPIIHMNIRFFKMNEQTWWFGGGIDLTPHYVVPELAKQFHIKLKEVCDKYNSTWYQQFKQQADDYFFIPHRNETRGIGGIFFDRLNEKTAPFETLFDFVCSVGNTFIPAYSAQTIHKNQPFDENHVTWQKIRRGRYAEFNLVYDRGTRFGLQTQGRTESILMSMPPETFWQYNYQPTVMEQNTLNYLKKGITWI